MRYVVQTGDEYDEDWEDDYDGDFATVFAVAPDGTAKEVGWIGGEAEDATYYRDYSWVEGALNDVYKQGFEDGREAGVDAMWDEYHLGQRLGE